MLLLLRKAVQESITMIELNLQGNIVRSNSRVLSCKGDKVSNEKIVSKSRVWEGAGFKSFLADFFQEN